MAATPLSPPITPPRKKKIVLCCDGTGNEFGAPNPDNEDTGAGCNSNVVKLYTALQVDNDQVAYYHPGVGTMGAPGATHWWSREWSKIKGLAFGAGFRDNVTDAYRYLMEVYNDNGGNGNEDEVYIFGFSRGAYTARALAGFLHGYGLLCRGNEGHIPYAWRMYVAQHAHRHKNRVEPDEPFQLTFSHKNFKIHFLGVWDTVSSVGWITSPLRLFNLARNSTILRGRHAISIDEHRCFFQDNLLGEPYPGQDLVQVWFAGVHSDIGGSYTQPESVLSNITLRWMLSEVGLLPDDNGIYPDRPGIRLNRPHLDLIFGTVPPGSDQSILLYKTPTHSVLHKSLTGSWWVPEFIPHIYFDSDEGGERRRVPFGLRRRKLPPRSLVHQSVAERMDTAALHYAPSNVARAELVRSASDPTPAPADGTQYYRFIPKDRRRKNRLFRFFDRFVLTWLFAIFDIVVALPALVWVVVVILASGLAAALKLLAVLWHALSHLLPPVAHALTRWFALLGASLSRYLRFLRHW